MSKSVEDETRRRRRLEILKRETLYTTLWSTSLKRKIILRYADV